MSDPFTGLMRQSRFLVIDESRFARSLLADSLRSLGGGSIQTACGVTEAVERLRYGQPDVILFEWRLSFLDGIEFTRMVRSGTAMLDRETPLVMVTARSTRSDVETARLTGVDEYLVKPFTIQALERRLREVLLHRREFVDAISYMGPCRRRRFLLRYDGPMRRFVDDDLEDHATPADLQLRRAFLLSKLSDARRLCAASAAIDRRSMRQLIGLSKEMEAVALELGDALLGQAISSLSRYLTGVGAGPLFDAAVIEAHLDAAEQLASLPFVEEPVRREVAAELAHLVRRKLVRARAP